MGKDLNSTHRIAHKVCLDLMNQSQHIDRVVSNFTSEQIANNRIQLKASIDVVRHLSLQAIAFRGRDESSTSTNRGNFLTTLDLMMGYNNNIVEIMAKAPKNATYTSPQIQKEILHVISTKVKKAIRKEIGDAKFCILVDEARDESMKEQMAVVLRYVDTNGFVRERFFGIVHVVDTTAVTLKKEIYYLFSNYCLDIQNIQGQGYDSASNMRGEWNGLQALILNDCPYAYYIHCFAHRLQLALVGASKAVVHFNRFFTKLILVINNIRASCKRIEQLKIARASDIAYLIDIEELEIGKGLNQMVTLQRPGDTRWDNFYPIDFTDDEKNDLKKELDLYKYDVVQHLGFKNLENISKLCQWMDPTVENLLPDFDFDHTVGRQLASTGGTQSVVLMVVNATDFDGSFLRKVAKLVSEKIEENSEALKQGKSGNLPRMVMVVTKIDLLPTELSPTRLEHWVRQRAREGGAASKLTNVHIIKGKRVQQVKLFHQLPHQNSLDSHTVQQLVQEQIVQSLKGLIVIKGLSLVLQR
ncbi:uncharacterized protein LOC112008393 [Quercus suber]|uniref:uncharacterized protein LOC112008393 n=1 Tax=Quercus suber TaxID=58331 RepID=UPI0032E03288